MCVCCACVCVCVLCVNVCVLCMCMCVCVMCVCVCVVCVCVCVVRVYVCVYLSPSKQVAGYVTVYDTNSFTFLTVKGSGHMVSGVCPHMTTIQVTYI